MDIHQLYKERCRYLREIGLDYTELNCYDNFKDLMTEEAFKVIMRDKQNRKNKRNRTKEKFKRMIQIYNNSKAKRKYLVFGTLTLDDKHLALKEDTYIREIHKWLKEHFLIAILNKDFGEKKGREHYHFIGITSNEIEQLYNEKGQPKKSKKGYDLFELKNKNYKLGFEPTLCIVDFDKSDINKTTNYLLKLNNHSNKFLTKSRVRVIKSPLLRVFEIRYTK